MERCGYLREIIFKRFMAGMAAMLCLSLFFCIFFSCHVTATERLEDFSDLVKSIDAEAEKPAEKKGKTEKPAEKKGKTDKPAGSAKSAEKPAEKKGTAEKQTVSGGSAETEAGENDRLKDFAETARQSEEGYDTDDRDDERLKEFAETARESGEGYEDMPEIADERLLAFSEVSDRLEKQYAKKYGAVIEDHVITDPSKYNDGDRVVTTENTISTFHTVSSASIFGNKGTDSGKRSSYRTESTERYIRGLFAGNKKTPGQEKYKERNLEDYLYNDSRSLGIFTLTAYDACIECCGKTDGITATGTKAEVGRTIAVDPVVIPYGSKVMINGHVYVAEDAGSKIRGNTIDIFMSTHEEAKRFGRKTAEVFLLE